MPLSAMLTMPCDVRNPLQPVRRAWSRNPANPACLGHPHPSEPARRTQPEAPREAPPIWAAMPCDARSPWQTMPAPSMAPQPALAQWSVVPGPSSIPPGPAPVPASSPSAARVALGAPPPSFTAPVPDSTGRRMRASSSSVVSQAPPECFVPQVDSRSAWALPAGLRQLPVELRQEGSGSASSCARGEPPRGWPSDVGVRAMPPQQRPCECWDAPVRAMPPQQRPGEFWGAPALQHSVGASGSEDVPRNGSGALAPRPGPLQFAPSGRASGHAAFPNVLAMPAGFRCTSAQARGSSAPEAGAAAGAPRRRSIAATIADSDEECDLPSGDALASSTYGSSSRVEQHPPRGNDPVDLEPAVPEAGSPTAAASSQELEVVSVRHPDPARAGSAASGMMRRGRTARDRSRSAPPAPARPPRPSAVARNDRELARALQHAETGFPEDVPLGREYLYVVEPCPRSARCRGCNQRIARREPRVLFQRVNHSRPSPAHVGCLAGLGGLVRPSRLLGGEASGEVMMSVQIHPDDRAAIQLQLDDLPIGPSEGGGPGAICHFEYPPRPRPRVATGRSRRAGGLGSLQEQLLRTDRDFAPEDYEMLLQLDERGASQQDTLEATMLLSRMPVSKLAAGSAGTQCSICLDNMETGDEVRTLPCMHFFHRSCIDKWISTPGAPARCPIDQSEISSTLWG